MSADDTPRVGVDGWVERTRVVAGRRRTWLERTFDETTGHIEEFFGDYVTAPATRAAPRRTAQRAVVAPRRPRRVVAAVNATPTVALLSCSSGLTVAVSPTALRTIRREIWACSRAIEDELLETGGGIFGPPLHSWHSLADVRLANVAAASRGRNRVDIAYGEIEAEEATLVRREGSHLRRLGCWHVHPRSDSGEPSSTDMSVWLSELDRIDRSRLTTRYIGIIATAGERGWDSTPKLHAWVVQRDKHGRAICEPACLTESRRARAA